MKRIAPTQLDKSSETSCPVCGAKQLKVFFEMSDVPVFSSVLWTSRDAAKKCAKGDIKLAFCSICSYIMNIAYDPSRLVYTRAYENPLDFSPRFQTYARLLAKRLVERYELYNKKIVSIGCGKGSFLLLLCELGNNCGVGFDPAFVEQEEHRKVKNRVKFIQDYYSERYADYHGDLIVCRQTLEHIQNPKEFLTMLRRIIGSRLNTQVFFEVPNASQIFHKLHVWDIIYEHCSYFTPISLAHTFSSSGFRVCELTEDFEGQFLCVHASPNTQDVPDLDYKQTGQVNQISSYIASFPVNYKTKFETVKRRLEQIEDNGQRAVVWGAGAKGVTFLNTFKNLQIEYAVDINPNKQGMYVAGAGQQVVSPDFLREYHPDVIIVMNPIYGREIRQLTKKLGLAAKFMYL